METPKLFVSYSRADSEFVLKLVHDMKSAGVGVWLDQIDIQPGERWDQSVEQALDGCRDLLVVLSPTSVTSNNVMDEVAHAIDSGKRIVPILSKECKVPFRLQRFEYVDFSTDYHSGLKKILRVYSGGVPIPPTPTPVPFAVPVPVPPAPSNPLAWKKILLFSFAGLALLAVGAYQFGSRADEGLSKLTDSRQALHVPDISGEWKIIDVNTSVHENSFRNLEIGFRVFVTQTGSNVKGTGEKYWENGVEIPSKNHTPISFEGTINGNIATVTFTEHGSIRITSGIFRWTISPEGDKFQGTFSGTAADSKGTSVGERIR